METNERKLRASDVREGQRYGRLRVTSLGANGRKGYVTVVCDCGVEKAVYARSLLLGVSQSCGCLSAERARTHGESRGGGAEYNAWRAMISRCELTSHKAYARYGGRGIKVCARWRESYANFLADMGRRPTPRHSLDRYPNRDGDYEPGNVRWGTREEQAQNKTWRTVITVDGQGLTTSEACARFGLAAATVRWRLKHGIPLGRPLHEGKGVRVEVRHVG